MDVLRIRREATAGAFSLLFEMIDVHGCSMTKNRLRFGAPIVSPFFPRPPSPRLLCSELLDVSHPLYELKKPV